jgi:catechol 2,3-dioxygenase-like lactoylglutathione lyase family enzyme
MTRLVQLRPMLETTDVAATVAFYEDVLGFTCTHRIEDNWANVLKDDVRLMFTLLHTHDDGEEQDHEHPSAPIMTGSLYFNVDDVDALAIDLGGKVALEFVPTTQPHGMRELAICDPNGYFLVFGMPVDPE